MKILHIRANCKLAMRALLGALFLFSLPAVKAVDLEKLGDGWVFTDVYPYGTLQLPDDLVQDAQQRGQGGAAAMIGKIQKSLDQGVVVHCSYVKTVQAVYAEAHQFHPDLGPRVERAWAAICYHAYANDYNEWLAKNPHYGLRTSLLPDILDRTDF